jgi:signal transduction histidine kinase/CheY-like chemotaxis protein
VTAWSLIVIQQTIYAVKSAAVVDRSIRIALRAAIDQETSVRGYAEARNIQFLQPYQSGRVEFEQQIGGLSHLANQTPRARAGIQDLSRAMEDWRGAFAQPLLDGRVARDHRSMVAHAWIGKMKMDRLRSIARSLLADQDALMAADEQKLRRAFVVAFAMLVSVGGTVIIVGLYLGRGALRSLVAAEQAAIRYAESKSETLAIVSHEIRTPLNGILGMARAMAAEPLPACQRERLEVMRESGETLVTLLNELLDASKLEAGRLELVNEPFDLDRLLARVHATFESAAAQKGVAVRLVTSEGSAGPWLGDSIRIGQICANLVSNAVKFTQRGEVVIEVGVSPAGGVDVVVRDTGIGMTPETVAHLFTPFGQADASIGRRFGGTGLGLAISRSLARLMKGEITAQSILGEGSTLVLHLPLALVDSAPITASERSESGRGDSLAGLSVLAADDNAVNRQVLTTILNSLCVGATMVEDGEQAVEAFRAGRFDAVLLDLHMPRRDGLEASRAIREQERASGEPRTPIILLTGDLSPKAQLAAHEIGEVDFVGKPLEVHALIAALTRAVSRAKPPYAAKSQSDGAAA